MALFLFGAGCVTYCLGGFDLYTPTNSNAYSVFISLLCHLGIVIGPASLFALKATNFSVYPSLYAPALMTRKNLLNLGAIQSRFAKTMTSLPVLAAIPLGLQAAALTLCDSLNLFYPIPLLIWFVLLAAAMTYQARALLAPLWLARQFLYFAGFGSLATVFLGYKLVAIRYTEDEARKIFQHI